jgi:uncharacterized YigZ family protein
MVTIEVSFEKSVEVKRSKFIAHLVPFSQFEIQRQKLREEHPKASHIVTAYRMLNAYDQIVESSSDDGEPKGCAGLPVLNVLRGAELINSALLIVRYFGGTRLGTGGMVRAYGLAAKTVLESAELLEYRKIFTMRFTTDYAAVQRVEYLLLQLEISDSKREFLQSSVKWEIMADKKRLDSFRKRAGRMVTEL